MVDIEYHLQLRFSDNCDEFVKTLYQNSIDEYNTKHTNVDIETDYRDSGFDLYITGDVLDKLSTCKQFEQVKIDHGVSCSLYKKDKMSGQLRPSGYYMFPRSSISKTPFRMANSVGIIDSGYRGNLLGKVDKFTDKQYQVDTSEVIRMFQLVTPDMTPFTSIQIVDTLTSTTRNTGGFGSTGK
jgi:dUTP pyrophosphatase